MQESVAVPNSSGYKLLKDSPNAKDIDTLLLTPASIPEIRALITQKMGETWGISTLKKRRYELRAGLVAAKAEADKMTAAKETEDRGTKASFVYELKTMQQSVVELLKLEVTPDHPQYKVLQQVKDQITSFLRRSAEFFSEIDHLATLRYAINLQQMRVSKMYELELAMGMILRDNSANIDMLVNMVAKSIEIHQSLGLKPKFGDPTLNLQINLGTGGQPAASESQTERYKRLKAFTDELNSVPPEKREMKRRELLSRLFPGMISADYQVIKDGDAPGAVDKH